MNQLLRHFFRNKASVLLLASAIVLIGVFAFLLWIISAYLGWRDCKTYTVTTLGDEWRILIADEYKASYEPEVIYDYLAHNYSLDAKDLDGIKQQVFDGSFVKGIGTEQDLAVAYKMPNLSAINKIKVPESIGQYKRYSRIASHLYLGELRLVTAYKPNDRTDAAFEIYTDLQFFDILKDNYYQYGNERGGASWEELSDRNAQLLEYTIQNGKGAIIKYTISDYNTTLYIVETYTINFESNEGKSRLHIYGIDEGFYFGFTSSTAYENVSEDWQPERPSEEFLMQFGVQRKVHTATIVVACAVGAAAAVCLAVMIRKKRRIRKGNTNS